MTTRTPCRVVQRRLTGEDRVRVRAVRVRDEELDVCRIRDLAPVGRPRRCARARMRLEEHRASASITIGGLDLNPGRATRLGVDEPWTRAVPRWTGPVLTGGDDGRRRDDHGPRNESRMLHPMTHGPRVSWVRAERKRHPTTRPVAARSKKIILGGGRAHVVLLLRGARHPRDYRCAAAGVWRLRSGHTSPATA